MPATLFFYKINDRIGLTHDTMEYTHDRTRFTHDTIGLIYDRMNVSPDERKKHLNGFYD